jgi:O-antigen/teichoic acid export membrane protein
LPLQAWLLLFFFLFVQQLSDFGRRSSYIFRSARQASLNSLTIYPLRILLLVVIHPSDVTSFLWILLLTSLPPALMVLVRALKTLSFDTSFFQNTREHLREAKWLLISSPFSFLWGMIPVYTGGLILSLNEIGLYATLNSINNVGNVAMELLETEFSANAGKVAASDSASMKTLFRKVLATGLGAWVLGMVVVIVFRDLIIRIIAGNAYMAGEKLMILLWASVLFMFLSRLDTVLLRTMEKTRAVFNSYFIATLVALLSAWPLIKALGVYGIAVSVILATLSIFLYQRYVIYQNGRRRPSREKVIHNG